MGNLNRFIRREECGKTYPIAVEKKQTSHIEKRQKNTKHIAPTHLQLGDLLLLEALLLIHAQHVLVYRTGRHAVHVVRDACAAKARYSNNIALNTT